MQPSLSKKEHRFLSFFLNKVLGHLMLGNQIQKHKSNTPYIYTLMKTGSTQLKLLEMFQRFI